MDITGEKILPTKRYNGTLDLENDSKSVRLKSLVWNLKAAAGGGTCRIQEIIHESSVFEVILNGFGIISSKSQRLFGISFGKVVFRYMRVFI